MSNLDHIIYLVGLMGWPVAHSMSPVMHHAAAADLDLDLSYVRLPVRPSDLPAAVAGLAPLGFQGVNITVPHKEAVILLLDEVDPAARAIGAVNTVVVQSDRHKPSRLQGFNTDWSGFLAALTDLGLDINGRQCLVLGAGGSARAVVYGLAKSNGQVHIFSRRPEQSGELVADLTPHFQKPRLHAYDWTALSKITSQSPAGTLIVNTTPIGMHPPASESPWPQALDFPTDAFIYDLVYTPVRTQLIHQAQTAGYRTANGLSMLLHQGAQAFKIWTGMDPNLEIMASALK